MPTEPDPRQQSSPDRFPTDGEEVLGVGAYGIMSRRYVERRIAELPSRPEDEDARLRGLLDIYDDITGRGHPDPMSLMASVLGIPVEVLVTHLRAAGRD